jgi:predicted nucleic-acid-binding Zn-ribbon protein
MKLNWIRPEDVHYYSETGINYFKLQGRTNVFDGNPAKAVMHYMNESYDGDLISLLELFSDSKPLSLAQAKIDNRKLDGFFKKFFDNPGFCTKVCSECGYCAIFSEASISSIDKMLMDIMKPVFKTVLQEFPRSLDEEEEQSE